MITKRGAPLRAYCALSESFSRLQSNRARCTYIADIHICTYVRMYVRSFVRSSDRARAIARFLIARPRRYVDMNYARTMRRTRTTHRYACTRGAQ